MINKITSKSQQTLLIVLGFAVYFTSYLTRNGFSTMLVEISRAENYPDTLLSYAVTASFVAYAVGLLISGYFGDKFNPLRIISVGLSASAIINVLLPLAPNPTVMTVLMGCNGFFQAFVYPPIVKTLSSYLPEDKYSGGILTVACAGNAGVLSVTLLSPLFIHFCGWRTAFYFFGGFAVLVIVAWTVYSNTAVKKNGKVGTADTVGNVNESSLGFVKPALTAGVIFVMIAIFCEGFVKDSAITWMPTYISEVFEMSSEQSILSNILFPILGAFVGMFATFLKKKCIGNELVLAAIFMGASAVFSVLLILLPQNYVISMLLLTLIITAMTGANFITINFVPIRFTKYGKVSLMAGMLNACTFVGSSLATVSVAYIKNGSGWVTVLILWTLVSLAGIAVALIPSRKISKLK